MSTRAKRPVRRDGPSRVFSGRSETLKFNSQVQDIARRLSLIRCEVTTTVFALKFQNCEVDADVAAVLQRSVADRLQEQIEQLESLAKLIPFTSKR